MIAILSKLSLRVKFALSSTLVLFLVSSFILTYFWKLQTDQAHRLMENKIQSMADVMGVSIGNALQGNNLTAIFDAFNLAKRDKNLIYIFVLDTSYNSLAEFNPDREIVDTRTLAQKTGITRQNQIVVVSEPIRFDNEILGTLILGYSLSEIFDEILKDNLKGLGICVAILLFGLISNQILSRMITDSIIKLRNVARDFTQGKMTSEIPIQSRDEIGELGEAFNIQIKTIRETIDQLKNSNEALEIQNAERQLATQALEWNEAKTRKVMNTIVDGIITINSQGIIESFNPAAAKIFGYHYSEVLGENISILMPEPDRSLHDAYMKKYFATGKAKIIGVSREVQGMKKDGSTFPMDLAVSEIALGERRMFTGIIRDITERKRSESELIAAKDEAERANRAKSEFLSRMSHELRTPMNAVLGFTQLLEFDPDQPLTDSQKDKTGEIQKAGKHLLALINEVLDLSRIESGSLDISLETVDLNELSQETLFLITPLARTKSVSINNRIAENGNPVLVQADRTKLKQVLLNLISNAVKYNFENGEVTLEYRDMKENFIRVTVQDTGPGIDEEQQKQIFEPFNRLDAENSEIEGTGIGLTITRRLIDKMNGSISLESAPGKGSRFHIELPKGQNQEVNKMVLVPEKKETNPALRSMDCRTILYVEDNPANLALVKQILKQKPEIGLLTANRAQPGIDLARKRIPDLILMDINMPELDGIAAMGKLREFDETREIPIIAVSANAMQHDVDKALEAGFDAYITKPFEINDFNSKIEKFLKGSMNSVKNP